MRVREELLLKRNHNRCIEHRKKGGAFWLPFFHSEITSLYFESTLIVRFELNLGDR